MTEAAVLQEAQKKEAPKKKKSTPVRGKNKILTKMIDVQSVKMHNLIKKHNPSYPSLPRFLINSKHKIKAYKDKGLQESVLRGFYHRVENWNRNNELFVPTTEGE